MLVARALTASLGASSKVDLLLRDRPLTQAPQGKHRNIIGQFYASGKLAQIQKQALQKSRHALVAVPAYGIRESAQVVKLALKVQGIGRPVADKYQGIAGLQLKPHLVVG
jgi:hypothetical protein